MQYKQAQAVLSDFLLKCENVGVALPLDPLDAVVAAIRALSTQTKHEMGRPQIDAAMASMRHQFGVLKDTETQATTEPTEPTRTISPPPRKRAAGKGKLQNDVLSKRAKRSENQSLVDQLVQLGDYEVKSGHTQRGVAHMRAAKQLRDADDVITSGAQARQLDRIGPSTAAKVDAILHGGLDNAMPTDQFRVTRMNLRQVQRALVEVIAKCKEIHVQLPVDAFDGMLSAGEALRHSRVSGKYHIDDAVDELKQRYGLEPMWQQLEDEEEAKRRRRQKRRRLRRGDETKEPTSETESADGGSSSAVAVNTSNAARTSPSTTETTRNRGTSRIARIIENNPAKNPKNEELAEEFVELGGYELEHGEKQKGISRMAVAKQLREADEPITSGAQARHLPHVGPSAAAKIDEVLQHGKMKVLEKYDAEEKLGSSPGGKSSTENASNVTRGTKSEGSGNEGKYSGDQRDHEEEDEEQHEEEDAEDEGDEEDDNLDEDWREDDDEDDDGD